MAELPPYMTLSNGVQMPRLALGTFKAKGEQVKSAVKWALEAGYTHIDTASVYKNESEIGAVLKELKVERQSVFITSKASPYEHGYDKAIAACHATLERLDTPYLDLYLIHWPGVVKTDPASPRNAETRAETWRAFEDLYRQGKCRAIGVSNYTELHLQAMVDKADVTPPMVNQVEMHPLLSQTLLRTFCQKHNIAVAAYSPLGCGQLLTNDTVVDVAKRCGATPAQVLIRWALKKGCAAIPKSATQERIVENYGALSIHLSSDDVGKLDALNQDHHFCWSPLKVA